MDRRALTRIGITILVIVALLAAVALGFDSMFGQEFAPVRPQF